MQTNSREPAICAKAPFTFAHETMRRIVEADGCAHVDLLPAMRARPAEELFAMPGDPHPNARGHQLMADAILPGLLP